MIYLQNENIYLVTNKTDCFLIYYNYETQKLYKQHLFHIMRDFPFYSIKNYHDQFYGDVVLTLDFSNEIKVFRKFNSVDLKTSDVIVYQEKDFNSLDISEKIFRVKYLNNFFIYLFIQILIIFLFSLLLLKEKNRENLRTKQRFLNLFIFFMIFYLILFIIKFYLYCKYFVSNKNEEISNETYKMAIIKFIKTTSEKIIHNRIQIFTEKKKRK